MSISEIRELATPLSIRVSVQLEDWLPGRVGLLFLSNCESLFLQPFSNVARCRRLMLGGCT